MPEFAFHNLVEIHAELCYAECLLERAVLTFIQVGPHMPSLSHVHFNISSVCFSLSDH